jgi:hypothetical protein
MPTNGHADEEILAFADEIIQTIKDQRSALLDKIEAFHIPFCTAPEDAKEGCLTGFTITFLNLIEARFSELTFEKLSSEI